MKKLENKKLNKLYLIAPKAKLFYLRRNSLVSTGFKPSFTGLEFLIIIHTVYKVYQSLIPYQDIPWL